MNRVQMVTQKHYRVEKPGQKPNRLHEPPTGPANALGARARGCVVASPTPCHGRDPGRVAGAGRRIVGAASAVSQCAVLRARLPCPGLSCDTTLPQALLLCPSITIHLGVLRYKAPSPTNLPITIQSSVL